jgi:hypothetical protein
MNYVYAVQQGTLNECLFGLTQHIDAWGLSVVEIKNNLITLDGVIPADQLEHLGLIGVEEWHGDHLYE